MVQGIQQDISDGRKNCPRCNQRKLLKEFGNTRRTLHGVSTYCKICSNEMQQLRRATPEGAQAHRNASKKWRDENPTHHADMNARWKYGVDPGTYAQMLASQEGKCAICKTTEPGVRLGRFHIYHCHRSKAVRGLLCEHCNRGLGHFDDDPALLRRAADYLVLSEGCGERRQ